MLGKAVPLATPGHSRTVASTHDMRSGLALSRGTCRPLGATVRGDGVNFAVFSRHAQAVHLVLFEEGHDEPFAEVPLEHRTGDVWHAFVHQLKPGVVYGYRVQGPFAPRAGHRFNSRAILL